MKEVNLKREVPFLTTKLIARQEFMQLTDDGFARELGVGSDTWTKLKGGRMNYGFKSLNSVLEAFPDLDVDVRDVYSGEYKDRKPKGEYPDPLLSMAFRLNNPGGGVSHRYRIVTNKVTGKAFAQNYTSNRVGSYKDDVIQLIKIRNPDFTIPAQTPLSIEYKFYCAPDTLNKRDADNLVKILQDAIFNASLERANDTNLRHIVIDKIPAPYNEAVVKLEVLK